MAAVTHKPSLPACFAHRGAAAEFPENTLPAFRRALELGADGIELDVRLVHQRLLVIHDETLDRTTSGTGSVYARSLASLRRLDAGGGARIPYLEEVIELVGGRLMLNIEIKDDGAAAMLPATISRALRRGMLEPSGVIISSFNTNHVRRLRNELPGIALAPIFSHQRQDLLKIARELHASALHIHHCLAQPELIAAAHAAQLAVRVYTVNTVQMYERLRNLKVDAVFTDDPRRLITAMRRRRR